MLSLLLPLHVCLTSFTAAAFNGFPSSSRLSSSPLITARTARSSQIPGCLGAASSPVGKPCGTAQEPGPHLLAASFWGQRAARKKPPETQQLFQSPNGRSPRKAALYHALGTGRVQLSSSPQTSLVTETPGGRRHSHSYPRIA